MLALPNQVVEPLSAAHPHASVAFLCNCPDEFVRQVSPARCMSRGDAKDAVSVSACPQRPGEWSRKMLRTWLPRMPGNSTFGQRSLSKVKEPRGADPEPPSRSR